MRELFEQARKNAPSIIFIDEIDAIGTQRQEKFGGASGSDQERSTTLNQLLTEMDGFASSSNIVVIAATNRIQLLDDALVRSGRFDIKIRLDLPNLEDRKGIVRIHLKEVSHCH